MRLMVTGAGGMLGELVAETCEQAGMTVTRTGRAARDRRWLAWDMATPLPDLETQYDCVVHAAPLWLLADHVRQLAGAGVVRVVCFSSSSVLTKPASASESERRLAAALQESETRIRRDSEALGVASTVFRPTMIYGYGRDRNVTAIARFIHRYGFFPVSGRAAGRRQPVQVDALVQAVTAVLTNARTYGKTYELAGGEILTYRSMVQRIFSALGRKERLVSIPAGLYRAMLGAAGLLGAGVTAATADRMSQDMVFDTQSAEADFGFSPEKFLEHPERDLPAF